MSDQEEQSKYYQPHVRRGKVTHAAENLRRGGVVGRSFGRTCVIVVYYTSRVCGDGYELFFVRAARALLSEASLELGVVGIYDSEDRRIFSDRKV
jgi:limonene-1,2-epoxide hydrolase